MTFDAVGVFGLTFDFLLKICLSILWGKCEEGRGVSEWGDRFGGDDWIFFSV